MNDKCGGFFPSNLTSNGIGSHTFNAVAEVDQSPKGGMTVPINCAAWNGAAWDAFKPQTASKLTRFIDGVCGNGSHDRANGSIAGVQLDTNPNQQSTLQLPSFQAQGATLPIDCAGWSSHSVPFTNAAVNGTRNVDAQQMYRQMQKSIDCMCTPRPCSSNDDCTKGVEYCNIPHAETKQGFCHPNQ